MIIIIFANSCALFVNFVNQMSATANWKTCMMFDYSVSFVTFCGDAGARSHQAVLRT